MFAEPSFSMGMGKSKYLSFPEVVSEFEQQNDEAAIRDAGATRRESVPCGIRDASA